MLMKADNYQKKICVSAFCISLLILYTASSVYHAIPSDKPVKGRLRKLDHCCVSILIFGTYVPFALLGIGHLIGWILLGIVLLTTIFEICLTIIYINKYDKLKVVGYLFSGWISLMGVYSLEKRLGKNGLILLILGGIIYTIGSLFYTLGKKIFSLHISYFLHHRIFLSFLLYLYVFIIKCGWP